MAEHKLPANDVQTRTAIVGACPYAQNMHTDVLKASMSKIIRDERWAAWVAKGVKHDSTVKKRAIAIAAAIAAGGALSLVIFLLR